MKKKIIIGNWKMNNGPIEGIQFITKLEKLIKVFEFESKKKISNLVDYAIAAPTITLPFLLPFKENTFIERNIVLPLAAQNVHHELNGAYTGEVSLSMLKQIDVKYVIIGHSERRALFNETNTSINKKLKSTLKEGLIPVFAFGENKSEYQTGKTLEVIQKQLKEGLDEIKPVDISKIIFAYEPIWAIGTGLTPSVKEVIEIVKKIKSFVGKTYGFDLQNKIRVQYGGSVNEQNLWTYLSNDVVDGALIGGASVEAEKFFKLMTIPILGEKLVSVQYAEIINKPTKEIIKQSKVPASTTKPVKQNSVVIPTPKTITSTPKIIAKPKKSLSDTQKATILKLIEIKSVKLSDSQIDLIKLILQAKIIGLTANQVENLKKYIETIYPKFSKPTQQKIKSLIALKLLSNSLLNNFISKTQLTTINKIIENKLLTLSENQIVLIKSLLTYKTIIAEKSLLNDLKKYIDTNHSQFDSKTKEKLQSLISSK